jgi:hypothetical protein
MSRLRRPNHCGWSVRLQGRRGIGGVSTATAAVDQGHRQSRHSGADPKRRQVAANGKARPSLKRRCGLRARRKRGEIALVGIADYEISAILLLRREIVRRKRLLTQYKDIVSIASHRL